VKRGGDLRGTCIGQEIAGHSGRGECARVDFGILANQDHRCAEPNSDLTEDRGLIRRGGAHGEDDVNVSVVRDDGLEVGPLRNDFEVSAVGQRLRQPGPQERMPGHQPDPKPTHRKTALKQGSWGASGFGHEAEIHG
jgi:hypothetical protein